MNRPAHSWPPLNSLSGLVKANKLPRAPASLESASFTPGPPLSPSGADLQGPAGGCPGARGRAVSRGRGSMARGRGSGARGGAAVGGARTRDGWRGVGLRVESNRGLGRKVSTRFCRRPGAVDAQRLGSPGAPHRARRLRSSERSASGAPLWLPWLPWPAPRVCGPSGQRCPAGSRAARGLHSPLASAAGGRRGPSGRSRGRDPPACGSGTASGQRPGRGRPGPAGAAVGVRAVPRWGGRRGPGERGGQRRPGTTLVPRRGVQRGLR